MNQYQFRQAVRIDGQNFGLGVKQVPDSIEQHPDFLRYVKCGWISECEDVVKQETFAERAQRLAKRLAEKHALKSGVSAETDFQSALPHTEDEEDKPKRGRKPKEKAE